MYKTKTLTVRVTPDQHAQIKSAAEREGVDVSEFLRRAALGRAIVTKVAAQRGKLQGVTA